MTRQTNPETYKSVFPKNKRKGKEAKRKEREGKEGRVRKEGGVKKEGRDEEGEGGREGRKNIYMIK